MYLDANQNDVSNLVSELLSNARELAKLQIIQALQPRFSQDGNQFCFLYGNLPNDCVVGFGDTPEKAMHDFVCNWYNEKPNTMKP